MAAKYYATSEEVPRLNFEPGTAQFGNFINYYQFNSVEKRLHNIPTDLLISCSLPQNSGGKVLLLDIGCNAGDLTCNLYKHLTLPELRHHELNIIAVDLDPVLIQRANEANAFPESILYLTADFMKEADRLCILEKMASHNKCTFDMVSCFSVTMWIHLNHGDLGLKLFLRNVSSVTKYLLLEPQNWKSYRDASRRMRRTQSTLFQNLDLLMMNQNVVQDIVDYLGQFCGMELVKTFGQSPWGRNIMLFKNKKLQI